MAVSVKTRARHENTWNELTQRLNTLAGKEEPAAYFQKNAARFDTWTFLGKSRNKTGINLKKFYLDMCFELLAKTSEWCEEAAQFMQDTHKWHNRTGNAERGLGAMVAGVDDGKIVVYLYHSVEYGVYLETVTFPKAGYLGVIQDTLQVYAPRLTAELQGLLDEA